MLKKRWGIFICVIVILWLLALDYTHAQEEDLVKGFVERLYQNVLYRTPDPEGLENWSQILKCGEKTGSEVVEGFIFSEEFLNRNVSNEEYVDVLYRTCMNREGDPEGRQDWIDCLQIGFSRTYVLKGFMESQEFSEICLTYGIERGSIAVSENRDMNDDVTGFISRCYQVFLEREPDAGGLNSWTGLILTDPYAAQNIPYGFVFSPEMNEKNHSNEAFVTLLYRGILNREPDPEGLDAWVAQLDKGKSRVSVYEGFVCSLEFQKLLSEYALPYDESRLKEELAEIQKDTVSGKEDSYEGLEDLKEMLNSSLTGSSGTWSVYVKNLHTGEYMVINNRKARAASVIKIFAMEAIYSQIEAGTTIQDARLDMLLNAMITYSDNTSFNELLRKIDNAGSYYYGLVAFNEYLTNHNYEDTHCSGTLHPANTASAYLGGLTTTSVVDCGRLLSNIYYGTAISEEASKEMENLLLQSQRRWKIPAGLPVGTKCANKTGENDYAQNDVAIVYSPACDYILCVLAENVNQYIGITKTVEISSMVYDYFN